MQSIQNITAAKSDSPITSVAVQQQRTPGDFLSTLKEKVADMAATNPAIQTPTAPSFNAQTPTVVEMQSITPVATKKPTGAEMQTATAVPAQAPTIADLPQQNGTSDPSNASVVTQNSSKETLADEAVSSPKEGPIVQPELPVDVITPKLAPQKVDSKKGKEPRSGLETTSKSETKKISKDKGTGADSIEPSVEDSKATSSAPFQVVNANIPVTIPAKQPTEKKTETQASSDKEATVSSASFVPTDQVVKTKPAQPHVIEIATKDHEKTDEKTNEKRSEPTTFAESLSEHQPAGSSISISHLASHTSNAQPHATPMGHMQSPAQPAVVSAAQALERSVAPSLPIAHLPSSLSQPQGIEVSVPDNILGQMHLRAVVDKDGKIHATVSTESSSTHEIVSNSISHITTFLESERVRLDSLTVSQTSSSAAFDTQQSSGRSSQQNQSNTAGRQQNNQQGSNEGGLPLRHNESHLEVTHTAPIWHDHSISSGISLRA
ncbi:MAG: hypothetical protein JSS87_13535 [Acidobacteria bacterium]|nr:hypothetical protein [Acidobacteriota bacterium]